MLVRCIRDPVLPSCLKRHTAQTGSPDPSPAAFDGGRLPPSEEVRMEGVLITARKRIPTIAI